MKLKTTIKTIAVSTMLFASGAYAADGTITFTGEIVNSTCTIDAGNGTPDQTVNLGKVGTSAFKQAGAEAAGTQFSIALSGCGTTFSSAQVKFDAQTESTGDNLIKLGSGSSAEGIAIGLFEADGSTHVVPFAATKAQTITGGAAKFTYIAKYVSTSDTVKAGTANSSATFTVIYN